MLIHPHTVSADAVKYIDWMDGWQLPVVSLVVLSLVVVLAGGLDVLAGTGVDLETVNTNFSEKNPQTNVVLMC